MSTGSCVLSVSVPSILSRLREDRRVGTRLLKDRKSTSEPSNGTTQRSDFSLIDKEEKEKDQT